MIVDDRIELKDASHLWGRDIIDTEATIRTEANDQNTRMASIGPAAENISLISGIVNDGGRLAARGVGGGAGG